MTTRSTLLEVLTVSDPSQSFLLRTLQSLKRQELLNLFDCYHNTVNKVNKCGQEGLLSGWPGFFKLPLVSLRLCSFPGCRIDLRRTLRRIRDAVNDRGSRFISFTDMQYVCSTQTCIFVQTVDMKRKGEEWDWNSWEGAQRGGYQIYPFYWQREDICIS